MNVRSASTDLSTAQKVVATLLSIVLAFGMSTLGRAPAAWADDAEETATTTVFTDAFDNGGTIKLGENATITGTQTLKRDVVIYLDGHTVEYTGTEFAFDLTSNHSLVIHGPGTIKSTKACDGLFRLNGMNQLTLDQLTIDGLNTTGHGLIYSANVDELDTKGSTVYLNSVNGSADRSIYTTVYENGAYKYNYDNLTVNGGTYTRASGKLVGDTNNEKLFYIGGGSALFQDVYATSNWGSCVDVHGVPVERARDGATYAVSFKDCNFLVTHPQSSSYNSAISVGNNGVVTVDGGWYKGVYGIYNTATGATTTINSGVFTGSTSAAQSDTPGANYTSTMTINGGEFNGKVYSNGELRNELVVKGGKFSIQPDEYLAEGLSTYFQDDYYVVGSQHAITTNAVHGTVTTSDYAIKGETVTVTVKPDADSYLVGLTAMSGSTVINLTPKANNVYTFIMPDASVAIDYTCTPYAKGAIIAPIADYTYSPADSTIAPRDYSIVQTLDKKTVSVRLTASGVPEHANSKGAKSYWVGIAVPYVGTGYSFSGGSGSYSEFTTDPIISPDNTITSNGTSYSAFYFGAKPAELKKGYHIVVKENGELSAIYNVNTDGVKFKSAITAEKSPYGTVKSNADTATEGSTVAFSVTPIDGYEIDSVSAKWDSNYDGIADQDLTITNNTFKMPAGNVTLSAQYSLMAVARTNLSSAEVTLVEQSAVYDGSQKYPIVSSVKVGNTTLAEGVDYVVDYPTNCINAGTYPVTITAKDGHELYQGSTTAVFTITRVPIWGAKVALLPASATYDGTSHKPVVMSVTTSTGANAVDSCNVNYVRGSSSTKDFKTAGTITAVITGQGNYIGSTTAYCTIKQASNTTFKVKAKKSTYAASKSTTKSFAASTLYSITGNKGGGVTFKKVSGNDKITVNPKTGKVKVAKGLKKGKTYTLKVKATASSSTNYKAASKQVSLKFKIKK